MSEHNKTDDSRLLNKSSVPVGGSSANGQRNSYVEVFCRLKPTEDNFDKCVDVLDDVFLKVVTPASKISNGMKQELTCSFKRIFDQGTAQKELFEEVALDMVNDLVNGKNGLLFTYGITGSGKTYTLGGSSSEPGILPRCVTSLYNAVKRNISQPKTVRLDKNGMIELNGVGSCNQLQTPDSKRMASKKENDSPNVCETPACLKRADDSSLGTNLSGDSMYSIFISLIEIYNNGIYDLFDENFDQSVVNSKNLCPKQLRENTNRGIFVPGLTYINVNSVSEALTYYRKGKKRRKVAQTQLNTLSSRSHCVFTLYLVHVKKNADSVAHSGVVSQLSLCDLAGSERSYRTNHEGDRQKETNSINSSLMTLRACIEALRDNQRHHHEYGTNYKIIPYRDSKLTLLFRNFFEGDGKVRMILCLNPIPGDFEENMHVVRFAEVTQEVKVKSVEAQKFKQLNVLKKLDSTSLATDASPFSHDMFSSEDNLFQPFPPVELSSYEDSRTIPKLISYLSERAAIRMQSREELIRLGECVMEEVQLLERSHYDTLERYEKCKQRLEEMEKDNNHLKMSSRSMKSRITLLEEQGKEAKSSLQTVTAQMSQLKRKYKHEKEAKSNLARTIEELKVSEDERLEQECNKRIKIATEEMKVKLRQHDHRLKVVRGVLCNTQTSSILSDASNQPTIKIHAKPVLPLGTRDSPTTPFVRKRRSSTSIARNKKLTRE